MVKILDESRGNLLAIRVKGKIEKQDFEIFNPVLEKNIEENQAPCAYFEILDLDNVTPNAIVEDLKNIPKYNQFEKVAIVGDAKGKEVLTKT